MLNLVVHKKTTRLWKVKLCFRSP